MENQDHPAGTTTQDPQTYSLSINLSFKGPGFPQKTKILEWVSALSRRDIFIISGGILFVLIIEPLILFWLFNAQMKSQLNQHTENLSASLTSNIMTEVNAAVRDQLRQQGSQVTPLRATDPTSLIVPSPSSTAKP